MWMFIGFAFNNANVDADVERETERNMTKITKQSDRTHQSVIECGFKRHSMSMCMHTKHAQHQIQGNKSASKRTRKEKLR